MALGGYDAAPATKRLAKRAVWTRLIRRACTIGIRRGVIGRDGNPPSQAALARLVRDARA